MRSIWKFEVPIDDKPHKVPGEIVGVEVGPGELTVWSEIQDTDNPTERVREYQVYGTGHSIPFGATHKGLVRDGMFIWHLYELAKENE